MNSSATVSATSDLEELDSAKLPRHVAIIMDGNGRWARTRLLNRIKGHEKGSETVRRIVKACRQVGIPTLTLYAFSTENWQRPKSEVAALMALLNKFLNSEQKELVDNNIRLNAIGQLDRLPQDVRARLRQTIEVTSDNDGLLLNLALSYGGRAEIIDMVRKIAGKVHCGELTLDQIDVAVIAENLYTAGIPDPDLLIRTSGEMRISNFLLWQIAYAEIFVTPTLWPDFQSDEFYRILKAYQNRERRYGKV